MQQFILIARWPGLAAFALGGLLLLWRLLVPQLEPHHLLRWGKGRVEKALIPLVGAYAAPGIADTAILVGGVTLVAAGILLILALGWAGLLLAPLLAMVVGWSVANRQANRRQERLAEQVHGLIQALAAGLTGEGATGGVLGLLRRSYRQMTAPLREEFGFMELVLRGQADLGESLPRAVQGAADKRLRALFEILNMIYRESLDITAQRRALGTLLERIRQDDAVRRTVRIESRFGQTSQTIVLFLIPGFVVLSAVAGSALGSQVSVVDFYLRTLPGRFIVGLALLVEGLVVVISRRLMKRIRWD
jgi:Flp pilus assembly protein TadB